MVPKTVQDAAMREPGPAPPPPVKSHSSSILSSLLHSSSGLHHTQGGSGGPRSSPPPAPVRDASSLKAVRYGPGHEKFPSWPAAAPSRPQAGGSCRSKSWTEQTHYPKEEPPVISRPFNKRINPSFSQQLRTVMERCEKIGPETYLPRPDCDGTRDYNVPSPPERDVGLTQADLEEYTRSYQDLPFTQLESQLTQEELEQYSRAYDEASLRTVHQTQASYAQSEGYHSYVSSTDSTTTTPFLDRLRRESEAARVEGHESSSSGSSSETLKWHGSMSDVSSTGTTPLIAHSAKVQTPQRHHSESVLYLSQLVRHNQINNQRKLFPVSTYTVQPCEQHSPRSPPAMSVAERINELERQQAAPQQPRQPYPPIYDSNHRHSHTSQEHSRVTDHASLKAIQKKALLSFYERHHSAWKSEPQLSPPQPPPRPKPPPTTSSNVASRRSSSASDYGRREQKLTHQLSKEAPTQGENENLPVRHQHSSSCGSLSTAVSGPFIMGPAISIDDWVPARPPKKPHLRSAYPMPRTSSPDLPPPSPPPVVEDEVFVSDEPLPPPPPEDQLPDLKSSISSYPRSQDPKFQYLNKSYLDSSSINSSIRTELSTNYHSGIPKSYAPDRSKPEPQYENQPELRRCSRVRESCRASFMTSRDKEKDLDRHYERKVREESLLSTNLSKNRAIYQRQKSLESYFKNSSLKEDFSIKDDQIPVGPRINLDRRSIETLFPAKSELSLKNYEEIQPASLESKLTYLENHNQMFNKPGPQTPVDKKHSSSQLKTSGMLMNPLKALDAGNPTFRQLQNQFIRSASVRRDLHSSQPSEEKSLSKSSFQSNSERKSLRYSTAQKFLISSKKPSDSTPISNGRLSPPPKIQQHLSSKTSITSSKLLSSDNINNLSQSSEPSSLVKHLPHSLPAQCPPTSLQLSQSKASYLASYRREPRERERGLPNFEGSYKRTMSPSGATEPIKEKSASQDSGLDDKQSYSEGSKSPSQENLASSTVSSCDNIETSKTLPRNYSLSLLSPTKRPTRTPRTQSDPIKATPREVIEEVTKASDLKEAECASERLQTPPQSPSAMSAVSTLTEISVSESGVSVSAREDRSVEEPLRLVQRTEVTLRVNAPTMDTACQTDVVTVPLPSPPPTVSPAPSPPPVRHQLHEEIECDQLSRDLASQLSPSHRLQGILAPGPEVKRSTDYVSGLFRLDLVPRMRASVASTTQTTVSLPPVKSKEDDKEKESDRLPSDSAYFTTSECKARLLLTQTQQPPLPGNTNLHQKKEELVSRLSRKLSVLRAEAVAVEEEGRVNEALGQGVAERVSALARPHEASKFRLHVKEVGHITSLLLGLSGRLARAENALLNLPDDHIDRKTLEGKRDKLKAQLEEAKELKRNIDRRSEAVSATLYKYLSAEEYADYDHFIIMKAKLLVDSREITDKIQLGEEQLAALQETLDEPR